MLKRTAIGSVSVAVAVLGSTGAATAAEAADERAPIRQAEGAAVSGQYIVMLEKGVSDRANDKSRAAVRADGGEITEVYDTLDGYAAELSPAELDDVRQDPRVAFVQEDQVVRISETQENATWGLDRIDQTDLPLSTTYAYDATGSGVSAYIIDTGVYSEHTEFAGRVGEGYTAIEDGNGTEDCNGHGTHVAGTVAGTTYGAAKAATVVPVRVLDCQGSGTSSGVIAGMDWVAGQGAGTPRVANMSLGGGADEATDAAVDRMVAAGVTVAVAAGNDNSDACNSSPARAASAITVASSTNTDARSEFSNYGTCVDVFAPGSDITSAWIGSSSETNTISGTSMATPHVTGAAALYLEGDPGATPATVTEALLAEASTDKIGDPAGSPNLLLNTTPSGAQGPWAAAPAYGGR